MEQMYNGVMEQEQVQIKPLQQMWEYGVNDPHRSHDFKIRNRSGQVIYDWPTVHIYSLEDLSRASDYF